MIQATTQAATQGTIVQCIGAVIDIEFPREAMPGIADDLDDVRAHGKDERVSATALYEGREFMYRLVTALSSRQK